MPLTSKLSVSVSAVQTANRALTSVRAPLDYARALNLATGVGAHQADLMYSGSRTLAASAVEDLDLSGPLIDAFGSTLAFVRIKGIVIAASANNTNNVIVGGAATNGFVNWVSDPTDKVIVRPGGVFALFAQDAVSYPVTAGTGDLLHVANSGAGTGVTYDVVIIGASA
jgi:hypothetical protein